MTAHDLYITQGPPDNDRRIACTVIGLTSDDAEEGRWIVATNLARRGPACWAMDLEEREPPYELDYIQPWDDADTEFGRSVLAACPDGWRPAWVADGFEEGER